MKKDLRPTLLRKRMDEWEIPKCVLGQPKDDFCIVWRMPPLTQTKGGLYIPEDAQSPHIHGILMAMGPGAMDNMLSNGFDLGHVVLFERYAGTEIPNIVDDRVKMGEFLLLRAKQIMTSVDLQKMLESGKVRYIKGKDGRYVLTSAKQLTAKEQKELRQREKLLRLASGTSSEHEADTARKLAEKNGVNHADV